MFDNALAPFAPENTGSKKHTVERKIAVLGAKLAHKDAVIAEIMADHIALNLYDCLNWSYGIYPARTGSPRGIGGDLFVWR
jgi:hypothetical protein